MPVEFWRLRIYAVAFLLVLALHLIFNHVGQGPTILIASSVVIGFGAWRPRGPWLTIGVMAAVLVTIAIPLLNELVTSGETLATLVSPDSLWPPLLLLLIGSRVLASECALCFAEFWRNPLRFGSPVQIQSIPAAALLGSFFALTFYLTAPHLVPATMHGPSAFILSAMLGGTLVHITIVFLFFIITAAILDAAWHHAMDQSVLASVCRLLAADHAAGSARAPELILADAIASKRYTRADRLLRAAIELNRSGGDAATLATLSFDGFHQASRRFIRALLPFLPLLGFLGTVIGLATAISDLPHGMADGSAHNLDMSASLAGLALKFETTLLGLMASIVSSFAISILEKKEAELAAACMLAIDAAMTVGARKGDA